jgi:sulfur transfer complex TusBCD TusB component (DsrH family)
VYQKDEGIVITNIGPHQSFLGTIVLLTGSSVFETIKKGKLKMFKASLYDFSEDIEVKDLSERPLQEIVAEQYHKFLLFLTKELADRFPPDRPAIDRDLLSREWETPTSAPLYSMTINELVILKECLEETM